MMTMDAARLGALCLLFPRIFLNTRLVRSMTRLVGEPPIVRASSFPVAVAETRPGRRRHRRRVVGTMARVRPDTGAGKSQKQPAQN